MRCTRCGKDKLKLNDGAFLPAGLHPKVVGMQCHDFVCRQCLAKPKNAKEVSDGSAPF